MANIALNKPIIESAWAKPQELTNDNFKVYDGNNGFTYSHWPSYLTLDLQEIASIETIRFLLFDKDARTYKYRFLTSPDLINWSVHFDSYDVGYSGWQEFSFPDKINVRYIRIHCLWNSVNTGFHLVQMQVYDENTELLEYKITNKKVIHTKSEIIATEIGDEGFFCDAPISIKTNIISINYLSDENSNYVYLE
ncbi:MAG: discoidin domain-containing protein [Bacteroidales bacterium]|nr:discoidin domain-containing protein [Bacteroidales bacterium]